MTLPPGRARLATKPAPTGSPAFVITMGMVVVAFFAANAGGVAETTIRSTLRRTRSAASSGRRSFFCSANRYSMVKFFPSIHPSLLISCRNVSKRTALPEAVLSSRKPMRKIFPVCCASAGTHSAKSMALRAKTQHPFFHECPPVVPFFALLFVHCAARDYPMSICQAKPARPSPILERNLKLLLL